MKQYSEDVLAERGFFLTKKPQKKRRKTNLIPTGIKFIRSGLKMNGSLL